MADVQNAPAAGDPAPPPPGNAGRGQPLPPQPPPSSPASQFFQRFSYVLLTLASFALTGLVLANAYYQRQQFYPSVVYITKSNPR